MKIVHDKDGPAPVQTATVNFSAPDVGTVSTFTFGQNFTFTVPSYTTNLTVKVWGAGAGLQPGGTSTEVGGATTFGSLTAGGAGYAAAMVGTGTGGDVNLSGNPPSGGVGGSAPGGGGAGGDCSAVTAASPGAGGAGGASGGFVQKTYGPGELPAGSTISGYVGLASGVVVFNAAQGICCPGGDGQIELTWQ
jgi:hypothetical protein